MKESAPRVITIPPKPELANGTAAHRQLRVAAYCRVSTDDEEQLTSYEAQRNYYTDKIMSNPNWTMAGLYADEGITGTSAKKRPEFQRMIRRCRQRKIDMILTKSISRFARNTLDSLNYIRALKELGIAVVFEEQNINTLDSDSELIITMLSAFAQSESENMSANVSWGQQQAMREGRVSSFSRDMYGYRKGENGTLVIVPEEAEVVRGIYQQYLAGSSVRMIRDDLKGRGILTIKGNQDWADSSVRNILTNEKYCGDVLMQKSFRSDCITRKVIINTGQRPMYLVQNCHEAIVDRGTFDAVQAEFARRGAIQSPSKKRGPTGKGVYTSKYALSDRLVCGECGTMYMRCTWIRRYGKRIVWRCVSRFDYGSKYCHNSPTLDEEPLKKSILAAINASMAPREALVSDITDAMRIELAAKHSDRMSVDEIDRQIKAREQEFQQLFESMQEAEDIAERAKDFKRITEELAELKTKRQRHLESAEDENAAEKRVNKAADALKSTTSEITEWDEAMIRQLVETVKVLSAEKLLVRLRGGIEIEQDMIK